MRNIAQERHEIDAAVDGWTLPMAFAAAAAHFPDGPAVEWRGQDGAWHAMSLGEYRDMVSDLTLGIAQLGFGPREFGLILAGNVPEHAIADLALIHARGSSVSVYNTLAPEQISWIANHCGGTVAFVEDEAQLETMRRVKPQVPTLRLVILMRGQADPAEEWVVAWDDVLARGRAAAEAEPTAFDRLWQQVQPADLLSLIYTSGTTGTPKGVMYTHRNIIWTAESIARLVGDEVLADARLVSYLPLAHVAERSISFWFPVWHCASRGFTGTVRYCPDMSQLLPYLVDTRPTLFLGVPRVWEKLQAAIRLGAAADPDEQRRMMVLKALDVATEVCMLRHRDEPVPADLAAAHVQFAPLYAAIRGKIGFDQCRWAITSTAPTPLDVELFFAGIGLPLLEVWGMSELTGPATAVPPREVRFGTCGEALPGVEVRIADDGELLTRGGNVMAGYYGAPGQTADTVDPDGWVHTGDIAQVDADDYYRIVDRKKELIITSSGKNIAPVQVEGQLKRHPLIGQAIAVGDGRNYLTALLVLDPEVAPLWAQGRGIQPGSLAELAERPEVIEAVRAAVAEANSGLSRIEQIKRFVLLGAEWTAQTGELTPTQKLRRNEVLRRYAREIDDMYAAPPRGVDVDVDVRERLLWTSEAAVAAAQASQPMPVQPMPARAGSAG
ncbi:MAG: AMP-dependent synthetase/ligase [Frankiaceae bacterium]